MQFFKDIDDNQFWLTTWSLAATAIVVLTFIGTESNNRERILISELVEKGHAPIELACLYNPSPDLAGACLVLAQKAIKKE